MENYSKTLLAWYDRQARVLPWRVSPAEMAAGVRPDPYRVWLSEIMLQQTTVAAVSPYFERFLARWPTVDALAAARLDEVLRAWAGLGYYARARNLHKCAKAVAREHGGVFPQRAADLLALPGIGPYTAAAIAAIAHDEAAAVVDGNVERVMARLWRIEEPLPDAKPAIRAAAERLTPARRPGDYAQAVMDLGATICTPRGPACGVCPWIEPCAARQAGVAADLPRKRPKQPKPTRRGVAFLALDSTGRVLLRKRPESGLLGGMLGLPGGEWTDAPHPQASPPFTADWVDLGVEVRHTFTHFHLVLDLRGARAASRRSAEEDLWIDRREVLDQALPTLMKKAVRLGLPALDRLAGRGARTS